MLVSTFFGCADARLRLTAQADNAMPPQVAQIGQLGGRGPLNAYILLVYIHILPEVRHDCLVPREQDVLRLDIPVYRSAFVRVTQSGSDLVGEADRFLDVELSLTVYPLSQ